MFRIEVRHNWPAHDWPFPEEPRPVARNDSGWYRLGNSPHYLRRGPPVTFVVAPSGCLTTRWSRPGQPGVKPGVREYPWAGRAAHLEAVGRPQRLLSCATHPQRTDTGPSYARRCQCGGHPPFRKPPSCDTLALGEGLFRRRPHCCHVQRFGGTQWRAHTLPRNET
jgi:hypothetical protein